MKVTVDQKTVSVRQPNEGEWRDYFRANKILIRTLGGGRTTTDSADTLPQSLALYNAIKMDGSELTAEEAECVIQKVAACETTEEIERFGDKFSLRLRTCGEEIAVIVRAPNVGERRKYQAARMSRVDSKNLATIRVNPDAAIELFAAIGESKDQSLPLPVKTHVIKEVLEAIEAGDTEIDPT